MTLLHGLPQINKSAANALRTLLVSPDHQMMHVIRTSTLSEMQDPTSVPSDVSIETTVGVTAGQLGTRVTHTASLALWLQLKRWL